MTFKFAIGAVCELNSGGGPAMTVVKDKPEQGSKFVELAWFNGMALTRDVLPRDAVKITVPAPEKPAKAAAGEPAAA